MGLLQYTGRGSHAPQMLSLTPCATSRCWRWRWACRAGTSHRSDPASAPCLSDHYKCPGNHIGTGSRPRGQKSWRRAWPPDLLGPDQDRIVFSSNYNQGNTATFVLSLSSMFHAKYTLFILYWNWSINFWHHFGITLFHNLFNKNKLKEKHEFTLTVMYQVQLLFGL